MLGFLFSQPITCKREEKIHLVPKNLTKTIALPGNDAKNLFERRKWIKQEFRVNHLSPYADVQTLNMY